MSNIEAKTYVEQRRESLRSETSAKPETDSYSLSNDYSSDSRVLGKRTAIVRDQNSNTTQLENDFESEEKREKR